MTRTGGTLVVEALAKHQVDVVFGIPGTHNLEIYRALDVSGIRHVTPRHEQGAGYAADGYARVTGRPGVAITTTGPALLNIAAAVGQAYSDSVPLLVISPGMPVGHPARGNGTLHETKNQSAALAQIAAYSHRVASVAEIPVAIAAAFATFRGARPRPVHIEIPYDLLTAAAADAQTPVAVSPAPPAPDMAAIRRAAGMLAGAAHPALVVGGGAKGAARLVPELATRLGAAVFTTANGKGILAEDHPLAATSALHLASVRTWLEGCDVVLAVGAELASTDFWSGVPAWRGLIRIDIDPMQINVNGIPDVAIVADANLALTALLDALPGALAGASPGALPGAVAPTRPDLRAIKADARDEGARWLPWLDAVASVLSKTAIVVADNAMASYYGALGNLPVHRPSGFLFPTGYGTLGFAVPAAIGAALGDPQAPVIALSGDGGLMFSAPEIATAAAERICLPVVVFDNGGYGEIRAEMEAAGIPPLGVDLPSPDFVALAVALGGRGVAVESPSHLAAALTEAFTFSGPTVLVVSEPPPTPTRTHASPPMPVARLTPASPPTPER